MMGKVTIPPIQAVMAKEICLLIFHTWNVNIRLQCLSTQEITRLAS